ncbi:potassium channel subfamily K member 18-like [Macrobrachium rosenbergii]|uniref:potassium channel subfamily K member 18-like n=1 Tax=Macrobrachium rosenbergii TaxID=79674 RepID=UPI0034D618C0
MIPVLCYANAIVYLQWRCARKVLVVMISNLVVMPCLLLKCKSEQCFLDYEGHIREIQCPNCLPSSSSSSSFFFLSLLLLLLLLLLLFFFFLLLRSFVVSLVFEKDAELSCAEALLIQNGHRTKSWVFQTLSPEPPPPPTTPKFPHTPRPPHPHPHPHPHHHQGPPPHYFKPFKEKVKDCCRSTIAFIFSNVGVCGLLVGYTIAGAFIFKKIEGPHETTKMLSVDQIRNRTIQQLWNITVEYNVLYKSNWTKSVEKVVLNYTNDIIEAVNSGWDGADVTNGPLKWSTEGGFLYSLTVITTIGYGHISPTTTLGKITTILYAIFGLPVFLLYMANMGDILAKSLKWIYSKICVCVRPAPPTPKYDTSVVWRSAETTLRAPAGPSGYLGDEANHRGSVGGGDGDMQYSPELSDEISMDTESWQRSEKADVASVNIPISVSLVIMVALLYGGTKLFQEDEGWDVLTSFYFCFISLTTIGFGDYVPGSAVDDGSRMSFIYCSLYLMFGLALLSMCFNLMQEEVVHKITACLKAVRLFKRPEAT